MPFIHIPSILVPPLVRVVAQISTVLLLVVVQHALRGFLAAKRCGQTGEHLVALRLALVDQGKFVHQTSDLVQLRLGQLLLDVLGQ